MRGQIGILARAVNVAQARVGSLPNPSSALARQLSPAADKPPPELYSAKCRVEMWRGGGRLNISVAASFVWRCLSGSPMTPFPNPLIEPDMQISRIRLSDKTSRLHPRHVVPKPAQAYELEVPVKVREWIGAG